MDRRKVIYYSDELNDEFSKAQITPKKIDAEYKYERPFLLRFFFYRIIATPCAFFYSKFVLCQKTVNRRVLSDFRHTGYFIYGNHTNDIGDPFMPNVFNFPKNVYFIAHANNVSMPFLGRINPYLGAIPLPDDLAAYRHFLAYIEKTIKNKKNCIVIYPEAHIWPYYTKIRNFPSVSFGYPVKHSAPVFCFTNTYQKRRFSNKPRVITYIDGPFFPDNSLPVKLRTKDLRDRVYNCMCERAKNSNIEVIQYIKKENSNG